MFERRPSWRRLNHAPSGTMATAAPTVAQRFESHKSDGRRARWDEHLVCAGKSYGLDGFGYTRSVVLGPVVPWYRPQAM